MIDKRGCKHLDYETEYVDCKIIECDGYKWWKRGVRWPEDKQNEDNPIDVQFCKKRSRINGIFQCINPGEMSCFEPWEEVKDEQT